MATTVGQQQQPPVPANPQQAKEVQNRQDLQEATRQYHFQKLAKTNPLGLPDWEPVSGPELPLVNPEEKSEGLVVVGTSVPVRKLPDGNGPWFYKVKGIKLKTNFLRELDEESAHDLHSMFGKNILSLFKGDPKSIKDPFEPAYPLIFKVERDKDGKVTISTTAVPRNDTEFEIIMGEMIKGYSLLAGESRLTLSFPNISKGQRGEVSIEEQAKRVDLGRVIKTLKLALNQKPPVAIDFDEVITARLTGKDMERNTKVLEIRKLQADLERLVKNEPKQEQTEQEQKEQEERQKEQREIDKFKSTQIIQPRLIEEMDKATQEIIQKKDDLKRALNDPGMTAERLAQKRGDLRTAMTDGHTKMINLKNEIDKGTLGSDAVAKYEAEIDKTKQALRDALEDDMVDMRAKSQLGGHAAYQGAENEDRAKTARNEMAAIHDQYRDIQADAEGAIKRLKGKELIDTYAQKVTAYKAQVEQILEWSGENYNGSFISDEKMKNLDATLAELERVKIQLDQQIAAGELSPEVLKRELRDDPYPTYAARATVDSAKLKETYDQYVQGMPEDRQNKNQYKIVQTKVKDIDIKLREINEIVNRGIGGPEEAPRLV
jgi:hypothetical protein